MKEYRARFPLLAHKTYLNSCSYGALADSVEAALLDYLRDRREQGACWEQWVGQLEGLRGKTAELLGASPEELAILPSLTAGFNSFVSALDFTGERRRVINTSFDFPTTAQIWHAQKNRGAEVVTVHLDDRDDPLAAFEECIDDRTLVVSVPWVCYRNGRKLDVHAITELAHRRGALVIVDGYQGLGTMPYDVKDSGADVVLGGFVKYLLGTAGVGFMYVRDPLATQLHPATSGWFAQEDVHAMAISDNTPAASARRFEGGTPTVVGLYACIAALDLLSEVGVPAISCHIEYLTQQIKEGIRARGWLLATGDGPHGPMLAVGCHDMHGLVAKLGEENVVVSCRDNNIRISPHFYNDDSDIEHLFSALEKHRKLLDR